MDGAALIAFCYRETIMSTVASTFSIPVPVPIVPVESTDDYLYEVVNGQEVEIQRMGAFANFVASMLNTYIQNYLFEHPLGIVGIEVLFTLDAAGTLRRRPDLAFVAYDRWPDAAIAIGNSWHVIPDLVVEVVSPSDTTVEIDEKIVDYFNAGVRLVWVVFPESARIHVFTSSVHATIIGHDGELTGCDVLPGFKVKVADLYRGLTKPSAQ
jgi:Uma2 family endonuclease